MALRVLAVSLLGIVPLTGHAQGPWKALAETSDSVLASALTYLRSERPRRAEPHDNLNLLQPSVGVGAQVEMTKNWALRVDVDRYRPRYSGGLGRESVDTLTLGVQYRLGGG